MDWRSVTDIVLKYITIMAIGAVLWCVIPYSLCRRCVAAPPAPPSPSVVVDAAPRLDYRRVIVAEYLMSGTEADVGLFRRRHKGMVECPNCVILEADNERLMEARPDVFWGISGDGKTPKLIVSFSGEHREYRKQIKSGIERWPTVIIYSGIPGSWGEERFRMEGYSPQDFDKLIQMIDWAAEY